MTVKLIMLPKEPPMSWEDFIERYSEYSIAIDGFVRGGPKQDLERKLFNMNHHEEVDRASTDATCLQALNKVREGLMRKLLRDEHGPRATVLANDCDEDVCTTWTILHNAWLFEPAGNPKVNKLVEVESKLDKSAGAYPFHQDMPFLRELAWIYYPYTSFRVSGGLDRRDAKEFSQVVFLVEERILRYIADKGETIDLDLGYKMVGGTKELAIITEAGLHARNGMVADGIEAYVMYRQRADGSYTTTVGKFSSINPLDLEAAYVRLNNAEPDKSRRWGGGDMAGGSDRSKGTEIEPEDVRRILLET